LNGLSDLSSITARAYAPGTQSSQPAAAPTDTPDDKKPIRPTFTDRRLAPAFSIELSLAAQKILGGSDQNSQPVARAHAPEGTGKTETSFNHYNEGVGRREVPLGNDQRDVAPGSRLNIQI